MAHWFSHRSQKTARADSEEYNTSYSTKGNYGLAVLSEPDKGAEVVADIVFLHGLTGDREDTWTDKKAKVFWPRDLLPGKLPKARIITFGYDADVIGFMTVSMNRIGNHAQDLVSKLADLRDTTFTSERPILFVAHSLGGLLCEDTLLLSKNSHESHLQRIVECTRGIAFMGTPHCGADKAKWGSVLGHLTEVIKTTNTNIVDLLQPDSEVLARIQQEFAAMLQVRQDRGLPRIKITCFYECLPTTVMLRSIGEIVPKHSAILLGTTPIGLRADHTGMTKFTGIQDDGYLSISNVLWRWIQQLEKPSAAAPAGGEAAAAEATRQRWASPTHGGVYTQGGSTFSGRINASGGNVHQGNVMNTR